MKTRSVPYSEIARCPTHRLDAEHYIPHHHAEEDTKGTVVAGKRIIHLSLDVTVPIGTAESDVEREINAALDEPPCEWGDWAVGAAMVTGADFTEEV